MILIAKWPQFSWHKHPSWAAVLVCPCTHGFVQAADPAGGELFDHISIPCLYDLPNLPEVIPEVWWLPCCDCKGLQDCFKVLPQHELAQSHGGTNKTINLTHGPKLHLIWTVGCCHEDPQTKPTKKLSTTAEEGDKQGFFNASNDGGDSNSGGVDGSQWNPNTTPNTAHNNTEEAQTNEPVPVEITQLLESNASNSSTLDSNDADLVGQMLPGMVDDDNQPLPENIPTPSDEGQESAQFFSNWEHSGSCFCCIEGGRKNKACLSFNADMKPTLQQLFEMFFFKPYVVGVIIPKTNICLQQGKQWIAQHSNSSVNSPFGG